MPESTLSPGRKSAVTKGAKGLKRAGRKAAGTLAIRREVAKALKQLAAVSVRLETVRESLDALGRRLISEADNYPEDVDLQLEFMLFAIRFPEARKRRLPHRETEHRRHAEILEHVAARSGCVLPLPANEYAEAVSNLAWSLMCSRRTLGAAVISDDLILHSLDLLAPS